MVFGVQNATNVHTRMNKGFLKKLDADAVKTRTSRAQILDKVLTQYYGEAPAVEAKAKTTPRKAAATKTKTKTKKRKTK